MPNKFVQKSYRYKNYDYSKSGGYFITVCTKDKRHILSSISIDPVTCPNPRIDAQKVDEKNHTQITIVNDRFVYPNLHLTNIGKIVEDTFIEILNFQKNIEICSYVIMPNHVHLIILIHDSWDPNGNFIGATTTVSNIIRFLKNKVTKKCGAQIWQKRFYDHILRDENDFCNHSIYIQNNPVNWINDEYFSMIGGIS